MPITVTITGGDTRQQIEYINRVRRRLQDPQGGLIAAANATAGVWEDNFRTSGGEVGGWAELAQSTLDNRARQGMPSGPILIKYGALKAVVTEGFMEAKGPGSWSKNDPYSPHTTSARLTINKGLATLSARGWKIANQYGYSNRRYAPARPFWFVNRNVMAASKKAVEKWIADEVVR